MNNTNFRRLFDLAVNAPEGVDVILSYYGHINGVSVQIYKDADWLSSDLRGPLYTKDVNSLVENDVRLEELVWDVADVIRQAREDAA